MKEIKVFENKEFGKVRTVMKDGEPWFVLADVCRALEIRNSRMVAGRLDKDELMSVKLTSGGQRREMTVINESGLYAVIIRSDKSQAQSFRKWLTSEVIPTIRRTGGYVANEELFVNTYLPNADSATKELFKLNLQTIRQLNEKIEKDKPLVDFANHIQVSDDCISMSAMAKLAAKNGINIGRTRLFSYLRNKKILGCRDGYKNIPYQRYIDTQPWFEVKESTYVRDGQVHINLTPMVTPKGQNGIIRMLKKDF